MTIKKRGSKYVVTDSSGKRTLGKHKTREEAQKQLRAIESAKKKRKGK